MGRWRLGSRKCDGLKLEEVVGVPGEPLAKGLGLMQVDTEYNLVSNLVQKRSKVYRVTPSEYRKAM